MRPIIFRKRKVEYDFSIDKKRSLKLNSLNFRVFKNLNRNWLISKGLREVRTIVSRTILVHISIETSKKCHDLCILFLFKEIKGSSQVICSFKQSQNKIILEYIFKNQKVFKHAYISSKFREHYHLLSYYIKCRYCTDF